MTDANYLIRINIAFVRANRGKDATTRFWVEPKTGDGGRRSVRRRRLASMMPRHVFQTLRDTARLIGGRRRGISAVTSSGSSSINVVVPPLPWLQLLLNRFVISIGNSCSFPNRNYGP
uniref:Uncharacterized protein n=1 Tax=Oryza punctata TaxID=4537 RepID=A0A0E0LXL5_ORYPU